jgi:hypothetical protein
VAQKVETRFVDDLDGSAAAETVRFAIAGREYEIDLSRENAERLRDGLAAFVRAARRPAGNRRSAEGRPERRVTVDREQSIAVREWARASGFEVSDRGRIPSAIQEAYAQRGAAGAPPAADDAPAASDAPAEKAKRHPIVADPFAVRSS